MRKILSVCLIVMIALGGIQNMAFAKPQLIETQATVLDRSSAEFNRALIQSYTTLLVKLTGDPKILTVPNIENSLNAVKDYVVNFSYQRTPSQAQQESLSLHVFFDNTAIKKLLQQSSKKAIEDVFITINGVNGLSDYVQIVNLMRHLRGVNEVTVKNMHARSITLKITIENDIQALIQTMEETPNLKVEHEPLSPISQSPALTYQWISLKTPIEKPLAQTNNPEFLQETEEDNQVVIEPYHSTNKMSRIF